MFYTIDRLYDSTKPSQFRRLQSLKSKIIRNLSHLPCYVPSTVKMESSMYSKTQIPYASPHTLFRLLIPVSKKRLACKIKYNTCFGAHYCMTT